MGLGTYRETRNRLQIPVLTGLDIVQQRSISRKLNRPGWRICRKRDAAQVEHASIVQSDVRIVCADRKQFRPNWVDAQALGFGVWTNMLVEVYQHILRPICLAHLRSTQVELPTVYDTRTYTRRTGKFANKPTRRLDNLPKCLMQNVDKITAPNAS